MSASAAAGFVVQTSIPETTFEDLTIQNAASGALGIQFYKADGGEVTHCVTRNMSGNAVTFYYANQGTVRDSTCQGNIAGRKTTGTVVINNEVYGSSAEGVGLYDGSTDRLHRRAQRHPRQRLGQPLPRQHAALRAHHATAHHDVPDRVVASRACELVDGVATLRRELTVPRCRALRDLVRGACEKRSWRLLGSLRRKERRRRRRR